MGLGNQYLEILIAEYPAVDIPLPLPSSSPPPALRPLFPDYRIAETLVRPALCLGPHLQSFFLDTAYLRVGPGLHTKGSAFSPQSTL